MVEYDKFESHKNCLIEKLIGEVAHSMLSENVLKYDLDKKVEFYDILKELRKRVVLDDYLRTVFRTDNELAVHIAKYHLDGIRDSSKKRVFVLNSFYRFVIEYYRHVFVFKDKLDSMVDFEDLFKKAKKRWPF